MVLLPRVKKGRRSRKGREEARSASVKFGRREDYQSFLPDRREQRLGLGTFEGFAEKVAVPGTGQWLGNLSFPGTSTGKRERERWRIRDECIIAISFVHRAMQHNPTRAFRRIEMKVASSLPPPPPPSSVLSPLPKHDLSFLPFTSSRTILPQIAQIAIGFFSLTNITRDISLFSKRINTRARVCDCVLR